MLASVFFTAGAANLSRLPASSDSAKVDPVFLSLVEAVSTVEKQNAEADPLNLSALDYLSSVYEESDYYASGDCAKQKRKNIDASVYINGLPDELLNNFHVPVAGRITSPFGLREDGNRMHKGVDISLKKGDNVCAAFNGKVLRVGYERNGYGYFIILDHGDGFQSRYAHLQEPLVKPGDTITSGALIAYGGTSGNSTGPHLHFEIRHCKTPLDPTPLLKKNKS